MSEVIDVDFTLSERERLLAEIKYHLPAFLQRAATEQHDPVGDVRELLNLEDADLRRVVAVHQCLDGDVIAFGAALGEGLRSPITSSIRPPEVSQNVRGPIDWGATVARRAFEAGNPSLFVVRTAQRVFDTPENKALVWLLDRLESATGAAVGSSARLEDDPSTADLDGADWSMRIEALHLQLKKARRVQWLRAVKAEAPTPATLKRLRAARNAFYARHVVAAIESVLRLTNPSEQTLTEVLARRYFKPKETWRLFEVAVALRLARAFGEKSPQPRKSRLMVGTGRAAFARYGFPDGSEVALIYQAWPEQAGQSLRSEVGKRQGLSAGASRPDLFVVRTGPVPDAAILELKATFSAGYLGSGLSQLLGYLAERPGAWKGKPAGWLVAPASAAFSDCSPPDEELWVISAERVADAAVERFVGRVATP